nr:integrase, catalytic region, zinc finger, CCHC-type, peptidase aspartic, catalytic [Tanacetum cinerariifolium]
MIAVKLSRGLKTSNYDHLYAYLKQHEAHYNEKKMMLECYTQHTIDPLALMSNVSPQKYPSQSSTTLQSTYVPSSGQDNTFDDDVNEAPVQDLALTMDNIFQADQCDAFDSDVNESLTAETMFMANLSSAN